VEHPQISVNFAISADGRISGVDRQASGWTSDEDFERLKRLRHGADALLVGHGTLRADRMTLRAPGDPLRCVVSRRGAFDPEHPLFHSEGGPIHLLAAEPGASAPAGATLHHGELEDFLRTLARELGVRRIHCEGGGELVRALATLDLIEEIHLTWAGHRLFGGRAAPGILGGPGEFLPTSREFRLAHCEPRPELGECFLSYRRQRE